jgi:hypothetical protein
MAAPTDRHRWVTQLSVQAHRHLGSASQTISKQSQQDNQGRPLAGPCQTRNDSMAAVKDAGIGVRATIALLRNLGTTQPCATVGIQFIEPPDT